VAAHEVPQYSVYSAFTAHPQQQVRQLLPQERNVVTVCQNVVRVHSRSGMSQASFSAPEKTGELFAATCVAPGKGEMS
jgi:hypothetical protein